MKRSMPFGEHVDISSDDSSSSGSDDELADSKQPDNVSSCEKPAEQLSSEDELLKRAQMYQEYMKQVRVPTQRGSIIPFTSWTGLGRSIKQLYRQPLHYLTNIRLKQWDQMRIGAEDEHVPLDMIIHPVKAEASIWLIEEVHRLTSSHFHLAKLWQADPLHHLYIDSIFPQLRE